MANSTDAGYIGHDCNFFHGTCDRRCVSRNDSYVCYGPTNKDCAYCVTNAYRNNDGACVCMDGFFDDCEEYRGQCHVSCR